MEVCKVYLSHSAPNAIFTNPEVARVGMDEIEPRKRGLEVETRVLDFSKVPRAALSLQTEGLVKMVVEKIAEKLLGSTYLLLIELR